MIDTHYIHWDKLYVCHVYMYPFQLLCQWQSCPHPSPASTATLSHWTHDLWPLTSPLGSSKRMHRMGPTQITVHTYSKAVNVRLSMLRQHWVDMLLAGTLALDSEVTFHCAHKSYCQGMKNRVIIQYTLPTSCLIYTVQEYNAIKNNNAKALTRFSNNAIDSKLCATWTMCIFHTAIHTYHWTQCIMYSWDRDL